MLSSPFDVAASLRAAERRLPPLSPRRPRSDRGALRVDARAVAMLERLLGGDEFPGAQSILDRLRLSCARRRVACPSRATVYKLILRAPGRRYPIHTLPAAARDALYNLSADGRVPGAQLAFYCFNHGELAAIQYASGLPWLALYQAYRFRGWRPRSRGLLRGVLLAREIPGD
jgi:hypothetical protein